MKITIFLLLLLVGCSTKGNYEAIQVGQRNECLKQRPGQYDECMGKTNKSYEEYERERKEALEERSH
jgi:hypothetical protein